VAVSPDGTTAYVANWLSSTVSVIDTATNAIKAGFSAGITVGKGPWGVAFSPDGSTAYVTNYLVVGDGTVSVINTTTNTVTSTITGLGVRPSGVAVSPDGTKAYVANFSSDTVSVIDTATNTVDATITVGDSPSGVAVSPDGTKAYVANGDDDTVSVIDLRANASASASADPGVPGIFLTVAGPVGRSASESPVYYGADRVAVTSTYLLTMTRVSNIAPTITTLAEGTIDADGSFSSMTRLPALTPGVYNVQMVGTHVNGSTLQLTSQITIGGVGEFTSIGANIPVIK
jgi:YVTN family beta-propeller protein